MPDLLNSIRQIGMITQILYLPKATVHTIRTNDETSVRQAGYQSVNRRTKRQSSDDREWFSERVQIESNFLDTVNTEDETLILEYNARYFLDANGTVHERFVLPRRTVKAAY